MRLVIFDNYDKVSEWVVKYIRRRINDFKLGLDKYFILGLLIGIILYCVVEKIELWCIL